MSAFNYSTYRVPESKGVTIYKLSLFTLAAVTVNVAEIIRVSKVS